MWNSGETILHPPSSILHPPSSILHPPLTPRPDDGLSVVITYLQVKQVEGRRKEGLVLVLGQLQIDPPITLLRQELLGYIFKVVFI